MKRKHFIRLRENSEVLDRAYLNSLLETVFSEGEDFVKVTFSMEDIEKEYTFDKEGIFCLIETWENTQYAYDRNNSNIDSYTLPISEVRELIRNFPRYIF